MSEEIRQEEYFDADPRSVYRTLTSSEQFSALTGQEADLGTQPGDPFTGFSGRISGRQVELVPGRRLVQAWRSSTWPEGHYSILSFELEPEGSGTRLKFRQAGHPAGEEEHLVPGWPKMYWEPMRDYLRQNNEVGAK